MCSRKQKRMLQSACFITLPSKTRNSRYRFHYKLPHLVVQQCPCLLPQGVLYLNAKHSSASDLATNLVRGVQSCLYLSIPLLVPAKVQDLACSPFANTSPHMGFLLLYTLFPVRRPIVEKSIKDATIGYILYESKSIIILHSLTKTSFMIQLNFNISSGRASIIQRQSLNIFTLILSGSNTKLKLSPIAVLSYLIFINLTLHCVFV